MGKWFYLTHSVCLELLTLNCEGQTDRHEQVDMKVEVGFEIALKNGEI